MTIWIKIMIFNKLTLRLLIIIVFYFTALVFCTEALEHQWSQVSLHNQSIIQEMNDTDLDRSNILFKVDQKNEDLSESILSFRLLTFKYDWSDGMPAKNGHADPYTIKGFSYIKDCTPFEKLKNDSGKELRQWHDKCRSFWANYREIQQEIKRIEKQIYKRKTSENSNGKESSLIGFNLLSLSLLKSTRNVEEETTKEEKTLENLKNNILEIQEEIRLHHPLLTIKKIETFYVYSHLEVLNIPYKKKPQELVGKNRTASYTIDIYEMKIYFHMLTRLVNDLQIEQGILLEIDLFYKKDFLPQVTSWFSRDAWQDWYRLNKIINDAQQSFQIKFPYIHPTRLQTKKLSTREKVLAILKKDDLGKLHAKIFSKIVRFVPNQSSPTKTFISTIDDNYAKLQSFQPHITKELTNSSFSQIYTGYDILTERAETCDNENIVYNCIERKRTLMENNQEFVDFFLQDIDVVTTHHSDFSKVVELKNIDERQSTEIMYPGLNPIYLYMARKFIHVNELYLHHRPYWSLVLNDLLDYCSKYCSPEKKYNLRSLSGNKQEYFKLYNQYGLLMKSQHDIISLMQDQKKVFSSIPSSFSLFFVPSIKLLGNVTQEKMPSSIDLSNISITDYDLSIICDRCYGTKGYLYNSETVDLSFNLLNNPISTINTPFLTKLNLSNNKLNNLDFLKSVLPQLISLDLSYNQLVQIKLTDNNHEYLLKELNLSHNELTDVSPISVFVNLECLDLSNNQFITINMLNILIKLQTLTVCNNRFVGHWMDILPLPLNQLKYLDIGNDSVLRAIFENDIETQIEISRYYPLLTLRNISL